MIGDEKETAILRDANGKTIRGEFLINEDAPGGLVELTLTYSEGLVTVRTEDFFHALQDIRRVIEPKGYRVLCYGASLDVYPSSMALDFGPGYKAYRLPADRPAEPEDLVYIFEWDPRVIPATVEEQEAYYHQWFRRPLQPTEE
jgi:hypothetical protein